MTDNEIIKALECCANYGLFKCLKCPKRGTSKTCMYDLSKEAIDLINRKQAEVERLSKLVIEKHTENNRLHDYLQYTRADAIKEFAEKIDKILCLQIGPSRSLFWKISGEIDNLVKEMVGDNDGSVV